MIGLTSHAQISANLRLIIPCNVRSPEVKGLDSQKERVLRGVGDGQAPVVRPVNPLPPVLEAHPAPGIHLRIHAVLSLAVVGSSSCNVT
jgi:hypothetical protein